MLLEHERKANNRNPEKRAFRWTEKSPDGYYNQHHDDCFVTTQKLTPRPSPGRMPHAAVHQLLSARMCPSCVANEGPPKEHTGRHRAQSSCPAMRPRGSDIMEH